MSSASYVSYPFQESSSPFSDFSINPNESQNLLEEFNALPTEEVLSKYQQIRQNFIQQLSQISPETIETLKGNILTAIEGIEKEFQEENAKITKIKDVYKKIVAHKLKCGEITGKILEAKKNNRTDLLECQQELNSPSANNRSIRTNL